MGPREEVLRSHLEAAEKRLQNYQVQNEKLFSELEDLRKELLDVQFEAAKARGYKQELEETKNKLLASHRVQSMLKTELAKAEAKLRWAIEYPIPVRIAIDIKEWIAESLKDLLRKDKTRHIDFLRW